MRTLKIAVMALVAGSVCHVAQANYTINDLYLGFTQAGAQSDYIIDLGQAAAVGAGGSSVVDLSAYISGTTFNSVFTGGANGVLVSVVAGSTAITNVDIYTTQVRTNGAGNPAVPGSLITATHSSSQISGAASALGSMMSGVSGGLPTAGNGALDSTKSYTAQVDKTGSALNFIGKTGVVPFGTFDSSAVIYLDLYKGTVAAGYVYLGYFKVDLSTSTAHLSFTPLAAPYTSPSGPTLSIASRGNMAGITTNTISFPSVNGTTYTLYYTNSTGLTAPVSTWPSLAATIVGDGLTKAFSDITTNVADRFYSVGAH